MKRITGTKVITGIITTALIMTTMFSLYRPIETEAANKKTTVSVDDCWCCSCTNYPPDKYYKKAIYRAAKKIVARAPKAKHKAVKFFHDELCKRVRPYDEDAEKRHFNDFMLTGAFVEGGANPRGYAMAFHMLCHMAGIEDGFIMGETFCRDDISGSLWGDNWLGYGFTGLADASWNIVKLEDGKWYEIDCYMDDVLGTINKTKNYSYFLKTRKQMKCDHLYVSICKTSSDGRGTLKVKANGKKYNYSGSDNKQTKNDKDIKKLKKGNYFKVGNKTYKILTSNTVSIAIAPNGSSTLKIPKTVTYNDKKYKVTTVDEILGHSNSDLAKITKIVIPNTVEIIDSYAFAECKNVKTVEINAYSDLIIRSKAFDRVNEKAVFKVTCKDSDDYDYLVDSLEFATGNDNIKVKRVKGN